MKIGNGRSLQSCDYSTSSSASLTARNVKTAILFLIGRFSAAGMTSKIGLNAFPFACQLRKALHAYYLFFWCWLHREISYVKK